MLKFKSVMLSLLIIGAVALAIAPAARAQVIVSKLGGICIDARGESNANGTPIVAYKCTGAANQRVTYESSTHYLKLYGKCVSIHGDDGTSVILYDCVGGAGQKWSKVITGDGFYLRSDWNGKVMDVKGANWFTTAAWNHFLMQPTDIIAYTQKTSGDTTNQKWFTGTFTPRTAAPGTPIQPGQLLQGGMTPAYVINGNGSTVINGNGSTAIRLSSN